MVINIDERIQSTLAARLAQIGDGTLTDIFTNKYKISYTYDATVCRLFTAKPKETKALFRRNYKAFKAYFAEHEPSNVIAASGVLAEMAFIEFAGIDFSEWQFLDDYFAPEKKGYAVGAVTPFMIERYHIKPDDLIDKAKRYPAATEVLLPALMHIRAPKTYAFLIELLKSAGLEDSLRFSVFHCFLSDSNISTLDFFTRSAIEEKFTRFKSLKEAMTLQSNLAYACTFTAEEYLQILRAVATGDYQKYLRTANGTHRLLVLDALLTYRRNEFPRLARSIMDSGNELMRRTLLYIIATNRHKHLPYSALIEDYDLTLPEFAAYLCNFAYAQIDTFVPTLGKTFCTKLFYKLLHCLDGMEKTTYTFTATNEFPISTTVTRTLTANYLMHIANAANDKKLIYAIESRYDNLTVESQAKFLGMFAKQTKLNVRAAVIEFLKSDDRTAWQIYYKAKIKLTYDEAVHVSDFLKSKKQTVKEQILKEFLSSPDKDKIEQYLLSCKEPYKSEIGEEMQATHGKIDKKKLNNKAPAYHTGASVLTFEKPPVKLASFPKRDFVPIDGKRIKELYDAVAKFIADNADYEYTPSYASEKVTIGSTYTMCNPGGKLDCYPLYEQVKAIYDAFAPHELLALYTLSCYSDDMTKHAPLLTSGNGGKIFEELRCGTGNTAMYMQALLSPYLADYVDAECAADFLYQLFVHGLIPPKKDDGHSVYGYRPSDARSKFPSLARRAMQADNDDNIRKILAVAEGGQLTIDTQDGSVLLAKAYERNLVDADYLAYVLVNCTAIASCLTRREENNPVYLYSSSYPYPAFRDFYKSLIENCVNAELERGTLHTPYTSFVRSVREIYGTEVFAKATVNLRGMTLVRNSDGYWFGEQKDDILSKILKTVRPSADETFDDFKRIVDTYKLTQKELVRNAVYNLEYLNFVDKYLGINGFKSAVLYFAAHLNENLSEERIEKIKEYSTIDIQDFKDGAFDFDWYADMVQTVPPKEFALVYDNAKYITVAGLHKRAQRFFDARNGKITADEAKAQIIKSRNKDYCLIYSLIPLRDDADLLERYTFFGNFLKESKQFGSQRQLSERRTADIAFDNLARNAGYADSSVFLYEMESRDRRVLTMYDGITVDGYGLRLAVEGEKVKLLVSDARGKKLSSLPAAIAKKSEAAEIVAYRKSEEEKRKRLRKSLEEAMENEIEFSREQILTITQQPLIRNFFERLFLTDGTAAVILRGNTFIDVSTNKENAANKYTIAHPVTLKTQGVLRDAMKFVISNDVKQPFKQVFREIYTVADVERDVMEVLRYKGFNVSLKKTVAALKNRKWGVSQDIGLRKVYYRNNTVAVIFREFDYYYIYDFGNENRELESILFLDRRDGHILTVKDVSPVVFSETLRDVDLAIAISANNVYDYELAMSTFEMRHAMIETITDLLGIHNVSFLKENVKIHGELGTYVVNIRTGLTFKEGKGNLLLKTIENYDKPLALDFIDEDPMTADIVTKVLLLAHDKTVKDPHILSELRG